MNDFNSFNSSFARSIQDLCMKYFPFEKSVRVTGYLYWTIDDGQSVEHVVNEKLFKQNGQTEAVNMQSSEKIKNKKNGEKTGKKKAMQQKKALSNQTHSIIGAGTDITGMSDEHEDEEDASMDTASTGLPVMRVEPDIDEETEPLDQDSHGVASTIGKEKGLSQDIQSVIQDTKDFLQDKKWAQALGNLQRGGKVKLPKMCMTCGRTFKRWDTLKNHEAIHSDARPYICDICGEGCKTKQRLRWHNEYHHKGKRFKCDLCMFTFCHKQSLSSHLISHTGEKRYMCNTCGKGFTTSFGLKCHQTVHTGESLFRCDHCPHRPFKHRSALRQHTNLHHKGINFPCDICGKCFCSNGYLTAHKRVHYGDKPFHCESCPAKFTAKKYLTEHRRSHTGERPFPCDICGKAFTQAGALLTHKKKQHG